MSEYHYIMSEPGLWTVGTGTPGKNGNWEAESDHATPEEAAARVRWLNGGDDEKEPKFQAERIWRPADIAAHKKQDPNALYPNTVLWGMSVNGISNPTVATLLEEIAKAVNGG